MKAGRHLIVAIALAGVFLAFVGGLRAAEQAGMVGADLARRAVQVITGLALAAYANFMPKNIGPLRGSAQASVRAQAALRVGGWAFMLAGLYWAAIWTAAPLALANTLSVPVMACAVAVTLGYAIWAFGACAMRRGQA